MLKCHVGFPAGQNFSGESLLLLLKAMKGLVICTANIGVIQLPSLMPAGVKSGRKKDVSELVSHDKITSALWGRQAG